MENILKQKQLRKNFYITIVLLLIVLILARLLLSDALDLKTFIVVLIDGLFLTIITTLLVGMFLFYLTPDNLDDKQLNLLPARELRHIFDHELISSATWKFKGGFGRYFRSAVIPHLASETQKLHKSIEVTGIILNPDNINLCQTYAAYRNSVHNIDNKNEWTVTNVREELFATIILSMFYHMKHSLLNVNLYTTNHFSPTRIDISSNIALVTKIDKKAPTIMSRRDTYFYQSYEHEIAASILQDTKVEYLGHDFFHDLTIKLINHDVIETILVNSTFDSSNLNETNYKNIEKIIKKNINPYVV